MEFNLCPEGKHGCTWADFDKNSPALNSTKCRFLKPIKCGEI